MYIIYIYIRSEYKTHLELHFLRETGCLLAFLFIYFSFIPVTVKSGWALHRQINSTWMIPLDSSTYGFSLWQPPIQRWKCFMFKENQLNEWHRTRTANDWQDHKFIASGCSLIRFHFVLEWINQLLHLLIRALGIETLPTLRLGGTKKSWLMPPHKMLNKPIKTERETCAHTQYQVKCIIYVY